jgi:hypothetical protein
MQSIARMLVSLAGAGLLFVVSGCDCSGPLPSPCLGEDPPAGCGDPCTTSAQCEDDFYCEEGECTTDCTALTGCQGGYSCISGRCVEDTTEDGSSSDHDGGDPNVCADVHVEASRVTPNVILIVDQSSSMTADFGDTNRWDGLRDSLIGEPDGLIPALQAQIRFGVALYSAEAEGSSSDPVPGECPMLTWIPPALNNQSTIQPIYAAEEVIDETPTGAAINEVLDLLESAPDPSTDPTIFIIATDGEPDTCSQPNPQEGQDEAIAATERAYVAGIRTFIISVGSGVSDAHLQDMANAGLGRGAGDPDAPFYRAGDDAGLRDTLQAIIGGELSCVVTLEGMIQDLEEACTGRVELNGLTIPCDDPDGWRAVDETHIELQGEACDRLQSTPDATLEATFPCEVILI